MHPVFEHRLENRRGHALSAPQMFARLRFRQAHHRADRPGGRGLQEGKFASRIEPELVGLFLPVLPAQNLLDRKRSARDLQKRQPLVFFAPRDFIDLRRKFRWVPWLLRIALQGREQLVHALHPKRRAKKARKHASACNQLCDLRVL